MRTKSSGVRFDATQFEQVKKREGLETPQQVVDFLLNYYTANNPQPKDFKEVVKEIKAEVPPLEIKIKPVKAEKVIQSEEPLPGESYMDWRRRTKLL